MSKPINEKLSVTLPRHEAEYVRTAAQAADCTQNEWIRRAVLQRAQHHHGGKLHVEEIVEVCLRNLIILTTSIRGLYASQNKADAFAKLIANTDQELIRLGYRTSIRPQHSEAQE